MRLASLTCSAPMAALVLVDGARVRVLGAAGLAWAELERERSLCAWAITRQEPVVVVHDLLEDDPVPGTAWFESEAQARFFAAAPLRTTDGHNVGALCVLSDKRRELSVDERDGLERLARQTLELFERYRQMASRNAFERSVRLGATMVALTRDRDLWSEDLETALRTICRAAAQALATERVSVWRYGSERRTLVCRLLFERSANRFSSGQELVAQQFPSYFHALDQGEVIPASDARTDARTSEFLSSYLEPNDIHSMLDAPLFVGGRLDGVVCHEQTGAARRWSIDESNFAMWVASIASLVVEQFERRLTERTLSDRELRFRRLADESPDGVLVAENDRIIYVNRAAECLFGLTASEAIGRPWWTVIVTGPNRERRRVDVARYLQARRAGVATAPMSGIVMRDGKEIWIEVTVTQWTEASGEFIVGFFRDRSESEERFRITFDRVPTAVAHITLEGWFDRANVRFCQLVGLSELELRGKKLHDVFDLEKHSLDFDALKGALDAGGAVPGFEEEVQQAGRKLYVRVSFALATDSLGRPKHYICSGEDVTIERRKEAGFRRLVEGTSATGEAFFRDVVRALSDALGVRHALVAELTPDRPNLLVARAHVQSGELREGGQWPLANTACEAVLQQGRIFYRAGAQSEFPADPLLASWGAHSFLGVALSGPGGTPAGVICVGHDEAMDEALRPADVLRIFAARAEAELRRVHAEQRLAEALASSEERVVQLEEQAKERRGLEQLVGSSPVMQEVYRRLRMAAQSDVSVLITGESGTGKELAASAIHALSARKNAPFVAVNCSAIPEALLESELFGHVRGAFTGATRDKPGLIQSVDGGTLFLDEIGDVSARVQVKLLRTLEERTIRRVGDDRPISVDFRLISATHRDLKDLIASGVVREDFYYRIRVFEIAMPPLRDRREDIPALAAHLVTAQGGARAASFDSIDATALRALLDHDWPGNVRELRNAVEHALVTATGGRIRKVDLPAELREPARKGAQHEKEVLAPEQERRNIEQALVRAGGNRTDAARALGISRVTLWKRMRRLGIEPG